MTWTQFDALASLKEKCNLFVAMFHLETHYNFNVYCSCVNGYQILMSNMNLDPKRLVLQSYAES